MNTFLIIISNPIIQIFSLFIAACIVTLIMNKKPEYIKYLGYIITAMKFTEKMIPDKSPVSRLYKMDEFLKQFIEIYEKYEGTKPSPKLLKEVTQHMGEVHDDLEAKGTLKSSKIKNPLEE